MSYERIGHHSHSIHHQNDDWDEVHNQLLAIQKKSLEVNAPNDAHEKEADEIARKVTDGESVQVHGTGGTINRKGEGTAELTSGFQSKLESSKDGGQSLDDSIKNEMGSKMGADFSRVKIHSGSNAHEMNEAVNAKAFTHGQDIYFGKGNFDTNSKQGKELLAHELTHTIQQRKESVAGSIQRKSKEEQEFDVYVQHELTLFDRKIAVADAKTKPGLEKERKKFLDKSKKFSEKMTKKSGWEDEDYGEKMRKKFGSYDATISSKKTEVKADIAATTLIVGADIAKAVSLVQNVLNTTGPDIAKAQPYLDEALKSLEEAKTSRKIADFYLSGADELRLLGLFDTVIADYGKLIQSIRDNIDGINKDIKTCNDIMLELKDQKDQLDLLNKNAQAEGDVLTLIDMKEKKLLELQNSINLTITKANGTKRNTPALDEAKTQVEADRLKKQADLLLQDQPLITAVDTLAAGPNATNAIIAELVHSQLVEAKPDETIIFVNLQKLKGQATINKFKTFYQGKYGAAINDDLSARLVGSSLQLALELLNMDAVVGQVDLMQTMPKTNAEFTNASIRINAALTKVPVDANAVFAELISFNRDKTNLDLLKAGYTTQYPGHTLEGDIKAKIADANQQSYAVYLINAPAPAADFNHTGTVPVAGTQQNKSATLGGRITENKGVSFNSGQVTGGHSLDYTGSMTQDIHWLQFITWQISYWMTADVNGNPTGVENFWPHNFNMGSGANVQSVTPSVNQTPNWYVDSTSSTTPLYDEVFAAQKKTSSLTIYDKPQYDALAQHLIANGAKVVMIKPRICAYLVRDFSTTFKEDIEAKYIFKAGNPTPNPVFTVLSAGTVNGLDNDVKAKLASDVRYGGKYSYIR